jgi:hypothetical protein
MQKTPTAETNPDLFHLGNVVPDGYQYINKIVTPGSLLNVAGACLKWYNLYPPGSDITPVQVQEAREFIKAETESERLKLEGELGFVILHRAGDYLLLIITTWRDINEMWESVYYKFASELGDYTRRKFKSEHRGTYCVWELGPIWHERNAWVRYIKSKRDEVAKRLYLSDVQSMNL